MANNILRMAIAGALVSLPTVAFAGNGLEPRTPVDWPEDTACLTVVDRTQGAMLHLDYGIPLEDVDVTVDEVADSRTHQFLAFCRDHSREEFIPIWLTWKDVDAAAAKMLVDPMTVDDEAVLETSTVWKDCWFRITPDDARRPITFAEAMKGVDWDTSALAPGAYVVQGFTWEPAVNIYAQRPGIVQVVDGPDVAAVGPAAAVMTTLDVTFAEDPFLIEGCARSMPGSTLSGHWSITGNGGVLDWQQFAAEVPLAGETFELTFLPPPETAGQTVTLRIDVTDPMQRVFSAYPINLLTILPGGSDDTTTGCEPVASFVDDPCDTGGTTASPTTTSDPGTSGPGSTGPAPGSGTGGSSSGSSSSDEASSTGQSLTPASDSCACDVAAPGGLGWLAPLLVAGRRRRRSREGGRP